MTRVKELMLILNIDRRTAEFYEAIEKDETAGDLIIVADDGKEVVPADGK